MKEYQLTSRQKALAKVMLMREPDVIAECLRLGYPKEKLPPNGSSADLNRFLLDYWEKNPPEDLQVKPSKELQPPISIQQNSKKPSTKKEKQKRGAVNGEFKVFSGTKKEYTYMLCKSLVEKFGDKYSKKKLIEKFSDQLYSKVLKKFSDGSPKSVKIWMKRYLDTLNTLS